jgi:23S rRNA (adenine2503-C2)-methyltransferase
MLNPVKERNLKPAGKNTAAEFMNKLKEYNISCTMRRSLGSDIEGACGQLRNKLIGEKTSDDSDKKA